MKKCLLLCLIISALQLKAQVPSDPQPLLQESGSLYEHEVKFREWKQRQPPSVKGWKWGARKEYELLKRIDTNGQMPEANIYLRAIEQLDNQEAKLRQARTAKDPEWSPVGPFAFDDFGGIGRVNCIAFHPTDSLTYYLGFGQGGIWKTTNGGKSYTPIGDKLPILRIAGLAIDPSNPSIIYASLGDFAYIGYDLYTADRKRNSHYGLGVWKTTDGGSTWKPTGLSNQLTEQTNSLTRTIWINPRRTSELVVVGVKGIFKSFDAGVSWVKVSDRLTNNLIQDPSNPNILYASAMYVGTVRQGLSGILKSSDAGNTWVTLAPGIPGQQAQRVEIAISPANPNQLYAVTCNLNNNFEGFYRSSTGGQTWSKVNLQGTNLLGDSPQGTYGQGLYDLTIMAHPTNPLKVYVGGLVLFETADGGNTWVQSTSYGNIHPDQHQLAYNPLNKTFYLCNDGGLYVTKQIIPSTSTQVNWKFACNGINATSCYRIGVSADGQRITAGAQDNGSYLSDGPQNPWLETYGGDGMEGGLTTDYVYGSSQYGYIMGSGYQFRTIFSVFPPQNDEDTGEWTTPFTITKNNDVIIAGGNVYKVPVGKSSTYLTKISNFSPLTQSRYAQLSSALAVCKNQPDMIYVAKKAHPLYNIPSQVLRTTDGGQKWENVTNNLPSQFYPSYLFVDDDNANRIWVTFSNFTEGEKIYYSDSGGKTWKNISYNLPNLPANSVAYHSDDNDVVYVALDIGVYYLLPNATEWQPLTANLPNVIVSELEINKTTKKLYAATFGRGVWMTDLLDVKNPGVANFYNTTVTLYPNPNQGEFTVKADYNDVEEIEVVNVLGQTILQSALTAKVLKFGKTFMINNLTTGLYFVRLKKGTQAKVVKMWVM